MNKLLQLYAEFYDGSLHDKYRANLKKSSIAKNRTGSNKIECKNTNRLKDKDF